MSSRGRGRARNFPIGRCVMRRWAAGDEVSLEIQTRLLAAAEKHWHLHHQPAQAAACSARPDP
jgi:hypothetical protein